VEPGRVLDVARKMAEYERISYVACSTGDRDISIQVVARDNAELYQFVAEVLGNVPGVRKNDHHGCPFYPERRVRVAHSCRGFRENNKM